MDASSNDKLKTIPATGIGDLLMRDCNAELPRGYWFDRDDLSGFSLKEGQEHVVRKVINEAGVERNQLMLCYLPNNILVVYIIDDGIGKQFPILVE